MDLIINLVVLVGGIAIQTYYPAVGQTILGAAKRGWKYAASFFSKEVK